MTTGKESSAQDDIKDIKCQLDQLVESNRRDRGALWSVLVPLQFGVSFVIAGGVNWRFAVWGIVVTLIGLAFMLWGAWNARRFRNEARAERTHGEAAVSGAYRGKSTPKC